MVLVQKWPFWQPFYLGNIRQENVFYNILERENALIGYKKKEIQNVEKLTFVPKRLTHRFGPKMAILATFYFMQYRPGKCLLRYSTTKKRLFQAIKTRNSKSRKIDNFPKGLTHGFGPKTAILATFLFFTQYRPGKCLLRYSRTKKRLSRL